ncbi:hypothetical protein GCK32_013107 [Trichostrongylus colubriformis]|uniref:Uncharacterized protein n=1 Tax=Trichostrongylus colubriformis TaxID=6319 RepID=A0AAN8GEZ2_TRICO
MLHQRMSRADTAVCVIPKKALANILDRLGVTFSMGFTFGRQKARKQESIEATVQATLYRIENIISKPSP